jgi:tripartite-type tricarboxylate transporter receptor subunit TctC
MRRMFLALMAAWALVALLGLAGAFPGNAQPYPTRPLRLVVGFPPGGGIDVVARLFAEKLTQSLGQNVVVENRPGASGGIAARQVSSAEADGYTVLVNSNSMVVHQVMNPSAGLNIMRDLKPILSVAPQSIIIAAAPDLAVSSLSELTALAPTRKLLYGSPGVGSVPHLLFEYLFASLANVGMEHVPYQGAAQALTAAMTSQIQLASVTTPPAIALVKAGKIKGLAVTSAARASALPDVPTVAESGYPGFVINVWSGFFMPAATPKPVADRFLEAALQVADLPDVKDKLVGLGFDTTTTPSEPFGRELADEIKRWSDVVQKAKLRIQP